MDSALSDAIRRVKDGQQTDVSLLLRYLHLAERANYPVELSWIPVYDAQIQLALTRMPNHLKFLFGYPIEYLDHCIWSPLALAVLGDASENVGADRRRVVWSPQSQILEYLLDTHVSDSHRVIVRFDSSLNRQPQSMQAYVPQDVDATNDEELQQFIRDYVSTNIGDDPQNIRILNTHLIAGPAQHGAGIAVGFAVGFCYQPEDWIGPARWTGLPDGNRTYFIPPSSPRYSLMNIQEDFIDHRATCPEIQQANQDFFKEASFWPGYPGNSVPREVPLNSLPASIATESATRFYLKKLKEFNQLAEQSIQDFLKSRVFLVTWDGFRLEEQRGPNSAHTISRAYLAAARQAGLTHLSGRVILTQPTRVLPKQIP